MEAHNAADQMIYAAEKALKEHLPAPGSEAARQAGGDKVSDDVKKNVQEKIDALKAARAGTDTSAIKNASDALSGAMSTIGEAMAKNQPPPQDQKPPENPSQ